MPKNNNGIWTDTQDEPDESGENVREALQEARDAEDGKRKESK